MHRRGQFFLSHFFGGKNPTKCPNVSRDSPIYSLVLGGFWDTLGLSHKQKTGQFLSRETERKKTNNFGNTRNCTPREHLSFAPTVSVTWHLPAPRPLPSTNSVTAVT